MEDIYRARETREVDGALVDTYVAAEHQDQLLKHGVRVSKVLDRAFGYGLVLSGEAANVKKGFDDYIKSNMNQILDLIERDTRKLPVPKKSRAEEASAGLFESDSPTFWRTLTVLGATLSLLTVMGTIHTFVVWRACGQIDEKKEESRARHKAILIKEMSVVVEEFKQNARKTLTTLLLRHRRELRQLIDKKKKTRPTPRPTAALRFLHASPQQSGDEIEMSQRRCLQAQVAT